MALTAFARVEDRARALSAGFNMFVPKSVERSELIAAIANLAETAGAAWHQLSSRLFLLHKLQGHAVHTVAQACRFGTIIENVPNVGIAASALHFSPCFRKAVVNLFAHILFGNRRPETRPAGSRIKLGLRAE